jgi:hypothetical protein
MNKIINTMNKIIKAMKFLGKNSYIYNGSYKKISINVDGKCDYETWDTNYHSGNIEDYKHLMINVDQLTQYEQKDILNKLKFEVDCKLKNKQLGFDLFQ